MCIIACFISKLVTAGNTLCSGSSCAPVPYVKNTVSLKNDPLFDWRRYTFRTDNHTTSVNAANSNSVFEITNNSTVINNLVINSDQPQTITLKNISGHILYGESIDGLLFHVAIDTPANFWGSCVNKTKFVPDETCELSYQSKSPKIIDSESYFWLSGIMFTGAAYQPFALCIAINSVDINNWEKIIPPFKDSCSCTLFTINTPIETMATLPYATRTSTAKSKESMINNYTWVYTTLNFQPSGNGSAYEWGIINDYNHTIGSTQLYTINTGKKIFGINHERKLCTFSDLVNTRIEESWACRDFPGITSNVTRKVNFFLHTKKQWFIATEQGLYRSDYNGTRVSPVNYFNGKNTSVLLNNNRKIYVGVFDKNNADNNGLYKADLNTDLTNNSNWKEITGFPEPSKKAGKIYALLDTDSVIYIGTDQGLYRQQTGGSDINWIKVTGFPAGKTVRTLFNTGETIFAGTEEDGLYSSNDNGTSWNKVPHNVFTPDMSDMSDMSTTCSPTPSCQSHVMTVFANFHQNVMIAAVNGYQTSPTKNRAYSSVNNGNGWAAKDLPARTGSPYLATDINLITGQKPWLISINNQLYINFNAEGVFDYDQQSWELATLKLENDANNFLAKILSLTDIINISSYSSSSSNDDENLKNLPVFITTNKGVYYIKTGLYKIYGIYNLEPAVSRLPDLHTCTAGGNGTCTKKANVELTVKPFGLSNKTVYTLNYLPVYEQSTNVQNTQKIQEVTFFAGADDGLYKIHYDRAGFKKVLMDDSPDTTWQKVNGFQVGAVRALERTGKRLYAATEKGLFFTTDGKDWNPVNDSKSSIKISNNQNIVSLRYTGSGLYAGTEAEGNNPATIYYTMDLQHWNMLALPVINHNNRVNSTDKLSPNKVKECRIMYRSGTGLFVSLIPKNAKDADAKGLWMIYRPEETATYRPYTLNTNP